MVSKQETANGYLIREAVEEDLSVLVGFLAKLALRPGATLNQTFKAKGGGLARRSNG